MAPRTSRTKPGAEAYSGRFLLRLPKTLHRDLVSAADQQGTSVNQLILYLLARGLGEAGTKRAARAPRAAAKPRARTAARPAARPRARRR
ncbi:MAG: toxin-antitoxin system HicB family antitoxin [Chloroflexi bacterium]|nr:toxin-antitoxin system HicB family antitoxin [Chloroflexota bacterium]